ncbi:hypothetical protein ACHAXS_001163 [Conticribra weissflogii]
MHHYSRSMITTCPCLYFRLLFGTSRVVIGLTNELLFKCSTFSCSGLMIILFHLLVLGYINFK